MVAGIAGTIPENPTLILSLFLNTKKVLVQFLLRQALALEMDSNHSAQAEVKTETELVHNVWVVA
jgi:hypothetical protein